MRAPIWLACLAMSVVVDRAFAAGASVEFAVALAPDGHPNFSTSGHPKLLHPERGVTTG